MPNVPTTPDTCRPPPPHSPNNMYISPRAARMLAKVIYGYTAMLNLANRHNGEDCTFYIDNDISYLESIRKTINDLYPERNSNER